MAAETATELPKVRYGSALRAVAFGVTPPPERAFRTDARPNVYAHELGHNFDLRHALGGAGRRSPPQIALYGEPDHVTPEGISAMPAAEFLRTLV